MRNRQFVVQGERSPKQAEQYMHHPLPEGATPVGVVNYGGGRKTAVCRLDGKLLECGLTSWKDASFEARKAFGGVPSRNYYG